MQPVTKKEADAYDRIIDAALDLADLIESCGIEMDEYILEELTIYLASNAPKVKGILRKVKDRRPCGTGNKETH